MRIQAVIIISLLVLSTTAMGQATGTSNTLGTTGITAIQSTTNTNYKLSVGGAVKLFNTGNNGLNSPSLYLVNTTATTGRKYYINSSTLGALKIFDSLYIMPRFMIDSTGKIGVGTDLPFYRMDLSGAIRVRNIGVNGINSPSLYLSNSTASTGRNYYLNSDPTGLFQIADSNAANAARFVINSSGNIGIGTTAPSASSLLDISSTTKGFLPPRMTAAQRNAIASPAASLFVWDTDSLRFMAHNGTAWKGLRWTSDAAGGSTGYIENTTTQQANSNFNISGNGTIAGKLITGRIESPTPYVTLDPSGGGTTSDFVIDAGNSALTLQNQYLIGWANNGFAAADAGFTRAGNAEINVSGAATNAYALAKLNADMYYAQSKIFIGTTTDAGYKLDVAGSLRNTTNAYLATGSGNVGIGTTTPSSFYKLDVNGKQRITGSSVSWSDPLLYLVDNSSVVNTHVGVTTFSPNMPIGQYHNGLMFGIGHSPYNEGIMSFKYNGLNSSSNYISFSLYGVGDILTMAGTGNVGIGTTTNPATAKLHVAGNFKLVDGTQGIGKVLTSDADGLASWQTPAAGGGSNLWTGVAGGNIYSTALSGNVGIGTTSPAYKLDVNGATRVQGTSDAVQLQITANSTQNTDLFRTVGSNGNTNFRVTKDGNPVWVANGYDAVSLPQAAFQPTTIWDGTNLAWGNLNQQIVIGAIHGGYTPKPNIEFNGYGTTINTAFGTTLKVVNPSGGFGAPSGIVMAIKGTNGQTGNLQQWQNDSGLPLSAVTADGRFLIGTTNNLTQYKLAVGGDMIAEKIKVKLQSGWADYVFEPTYKLPTLKEVEEFIKENKHLPGVPSAAEIEKNGLDLGDGQAVLLKKIEEMTLYMIDMNKKIEKLAAENELMKKKLEKTESK
jgi:hypothetical protein